MLIVVLSPEVAQLRPRPAFVPRRLGIHQRVDAGLGDDQGHVSHPCGNQVLAVDLAVAKRILEKNDATEKIVVSESGIRTPADLRFLQKCGAHAFLIGSAIMMAENLEKKVKEFVTTS